MVMMSLEMTSGSVDWQGDGKHLLSFQGASTQLKSHPKLRNDVKKGETRGNFLQPQRVSLACGRRKNRMHACAATLATVRLMRTPWLVPAPHSCASEQTAHCGSCTLSTTAVLRALQCFGACTGAHPLKHPGLNRGWPGACSCLIRWSRLSRNELWDEQLGGGRDWRRGWNNMWLIPASRRPDHVTYWSTWKFSGREEAPVKSIFLTINLPSWPYPSTTSFAESRLVSLANWTTHPWSYCCC